MAVWIAGFPLLPAALDVLGSLATSSNKEGHRGCMWVHLQHLPTFRASPQPQAMKSMKSLLVLGRRFPPFHPWN